MLRDRLVEILENSLQNAVDDKKIEDVDLPSIKIEYPKEEQFGDYATPFALESARILRKSPIDIGTILKEYISTSPLVERVDIVKPGFINIFISLDFLHENLRAILKDNEGYSKNVQKSPKRINLEFVSANPTGPLNIVSARAAALGDSLANLLSADGHRVHREFYVNDYGTQVYLLGRSVLCRYRELLGEMVEFPEDGYRGEYIKEIAQYLRDTSADVIEQIDDEEELINFMSEQAIKYNVQEQKNDLERFNVFFDTWFSERSLHENGYLILTIEDLDSRDLLYTKEGKKFFKASAFGDEKDRVVIREDGRPTYFLADIAYHRNKRERGFDVLINIWGPDHHGYIERLRGALQSLDFQDDQFKILIAQQVNLIKQGETIKMSKRLGKFSTMRELIEEIGVDVSRYFFVMRSMESHLDFDLSLAKKESSENPVFYLQYAHARICSIFREAEKRGMDYNPSLSDKGVLDNREAMALLKTLAQFPEEIHDAANNFEPHRIANYLLKLAQEYHKFYTDHRVLSEDSLRTQTYLSLCDAVRIVLKNGLGLLGISAPEKM